MALVLPLSSVESLKQRAYMARKWFKVAPDTFLAKLNPRFRGAEDFYDDEEFYDTFLHSQVCNQLLDLMSLSRIGLIPCRIFTHGLPDVICRL